MFLTARVCQWSLQGHVYQPRHELKQLRKRLLLMQIPPICRYLSTYGLTMVFLSVHGMMRNHIGHDNTQGSLENHFRHGRCVAKLCARSISSRLATYELAAVDGRWNHALQRLGVSFV